MGSKTSCIKPIFFSLTPVIGLFIFTEILLAVIGVQPGLDREDPFVGFVSSVPLFVEQSNGGGDTVMVTSANKRSIFNAQSFRLEKPPGTYRIFTLGGSTTYGRPYSDETSFSRWLRELLPLADGDRSWEVINGGGISYASYRVARVMKELCRYQPDLFVVYTGHNEFLEERTYGQRRGERVKPVPLHTCCSRSAQSVRILALRFKSGVMKNEEKQGFSGIQSTIQKWRGCCSLQNRHY